MRCHMVVILIVAWCKFTSAASVEVDRGAMRLLLGFQEVKGNSSFTCSPSGPCLPCQYSEKGDEKYHCSESGYRVPLKCIEDTPEGEKTTKNLRKLLEGSSSDGQNQNYIIYRSCIPTVDEEKLSVIGFEVIMAGGLLISGSAIYLRRRRSVMPGMVAAAPRLPTNSPRF